MTKPHEKWNSEDIANYARMSMHVDDYADHHSNSDELNDYYRHQDGKFPDAFQWRVASGAVFVWLFIALFVAWVV